MFSIRIPLFLDANLLKGGTIFRDWWDFSVPHGILFGPSGSGKTRAALCILFEIYRNLFSIYPDTRCIIADRKGEDFEFCAGAARYFPFKMAGQGLELTYDILLERQSGDPSRSFVLLLFDELAAHLSALPKKEREETTARLGEILMLGRSFNIHILAVQQTPYAEYFGKARDNFGLIVALSQGILSRESAQMFGFERESMHPSGRPGAGWMLYQGVQTAIQVPTINDVDLPKIQTVIRKLVE